MHDENFQLKFLKFILMMKKGYYLHYEQYGRRKQENKKKLFFSFSFCFKCIKLKQILVKEGFSKCKSE